MKASHKKGLGVLVVVLMGAGIGYLLSARGPETPSDVPTTSAAAPVTPSTSSSVESVPQSTDSPASSASADPTKSGGWDGGAFAPSLAGTDIDGNLQADADGNLVISIDIKDFFDYFFSAVGERSSEDVIAEIERQIHARLPAKAAAQALQMMQDYISYQEQMATLMQQPLIPAELQNYQYYAETMVSTFEQLRALRRQYFSPDTVDAFFGLEEAYGEYAVKTLQLQADTTLSDDDKVEKIAALESLLPQQMIDADRTARARAAVADSARSQFDAGASPESVKATLEQQFDEATASEIYSFYQREDRWRKRLDKFLTEKSALAASSMAESDRQRALDELRKRQFSSEELARLASEEAIQDKIVANHP